MKISILAENLNKALSITSRVVTSRAQLPILANVLLRVTKEGLEVMSTDLEIGVRIKVGAKVEEEGEICVLARTMSEYGATLGAGVVEITSEKEGLSLKAGKSKAVIPGIDGGEFPSVPAFKGNADIEMEMTDLIRVVEEVGFAAARDESRPIFTGMLWKFDDDKLSLAATDGYRLGVDELKVVRTSEKEIGNVVLPVKVLSEIVKSSKDEKKVILLADLEKQQVIFKVGDVEWVSRLLVGEFPPYQQIMPTGFATRVVINRKELIEAVRRAVIFAKDGANIIKLVVGEGKLIVSANSSSVGGGETEVEVDMEGEPLVVAFNGRYLLDYLSVINEEEVVLENAGALKAGVFKVLGRKMTHVIMPVRVQG